MPPARYNLTGCRQRHDPAAWCAQAMPGFTDLPLRLPDDVQNPNTTRKLFSVKRPLSCQMPCFSTLRGCREEVPRLPNDPDLTVPEGAGPLPASRTTTMEAPPPDTAEPVVVRSGRSLELQLHFLHGRLVLLGELTVYGDVLVDR